MEQANRLRGKGSRLQSLSAKGRWESCDPLAPVWTLTSLLADTAKPSSNYFPLTTRHCSHPLSVPSLPKVCRIPSTDHRSCFPTIETGTVESVSVKCTISSNLPVSERRDHFPAILTHAIAHLLPSLASGHVFLLMLSQQQNISQWHMDVPGNPGVKTPPPLHPASTARGTVQSLLGELRYHLLCGVAKR